MDVLIYLVPMALTLGLIGLGAFLWSMKTGQFDDLDGAAWRAIMDDDDLATSDKKAAAPPAAASRKLAE
jgi:cbb3-type cytochrome oxidase maturation protein